MVRTRRGGNHHSKALADGPNLKEILFEWALTFYSDDKRDRKRLQLGFRNDIERFIQENNITEATAWQSWRDTAANILLALLDDEDARTKVQNTSLQSFINDKTFNHRVCWMFAAHKLVADADMFAFDKNDNTYAFDHDAAYEAVSMANNEYKTTRRAATATYLKTCYKQALDLLWDAYQDLERNCPPHGQPLVPRSTYYKKLLNLEPVVLPQQETVVTLFPFKVDTFVAFWKHALRTGTPWNMLRMIMDPAVNQHLRRFVKGVGPVHYERELGWRNGWLNLREKFAKDMYEDGLDLNSHSDMTFRAFHRRMSSKIWGWKGWMTVWAWAAHCLVTDGAVYLTPQGTPPLPQDQAEFKAVRETCLELLHCVYLDTRAYPNGYWGSMLLAHVSVPPG
ncbi:hypothetical protein SLS55_005478 [Diplodia seriata]|uniref:Uncharacterized protein n=1 Tax=Diplodia seriata TaxID=420778 RepID=A0ABR3CGH9_9PEZI